MQCTQKEADIFGKYFLKSENLARIMLFYLPEKGGKGPAGGRGDCKSAILHKKSALGGGAANSKNCCKSGKIDSSHAKYVEISQN